ncbi:AAA family ATPase [Pelagibaculum spongiae]|uniref:SPOR domain-containing protein n=1 Tax=Pelagibaculum spongiae TaxID=2080658 RepID=A0A2V1GSA9_9GAMM|nr:AAA family ATPase [Pelagibaculum spongiae]PVZ68279.1 hypothetical protein DC094_13390 [Pelagibaculum spongiae]
MSNTAPDLQAKSAPFLPSDQVSEMLEQAIYMARFSDLLLLVSGDSGSGRTSFAREIIRRAADLDVLELDALNINSLEHLQNAICQNIGLEQMRLPGDTLIPLFVDQLLQNHSRAASLLIVDNADRLDLEALTWLVNLQKHARQKKLRLPILFTAEPNFEHRMVLLEDQVASGQQYTFHLHSMDREEAASWLNHPLLLRALRRDPLGSEQIDNIWQQADGLPGKMLQLLNIEMLEIPKPKSGKTGFVFAAAGLLVASFGIAWWVNGGTDAIFAKEQLPEWAAKSQPTTPKFEVRDEPPAEPIRLADTSTIIELSSEAEARPKLVELDRQPVLSTEPAESALAVEADTASEALVELPVQPLDEKPQLVAEAQPVLSEQPTVIAVIEPLETKTNTKPQQPVIETAAIEAPVAEEIIPELESVEIDEVEAPPLQLVDAAAKATNQPLVVENQPVPEKPVAAKQTQKVAKAVLEIEVEAELSEVEPEAKSAPATKQEMTRWAEQEMEIQARDSKHWTMQILAASKQKILDKALKEYGLADSTNYYRVMRNGKIGYVLIYGNFPSKQAAFDAVSALPKEVRKSKPWIRRYSVIHKSLGQVEVDLK